MKSNKEKNEIPVKVTPEIMRKAKEYGFSDRQLSEIWGMNEAAVRMMRKTMGVIPVYKTVDLQPICRSIDLWNRPVITREE